MPQKQTVAVRNRRWVRDVFLPGVRRLSEDGDISGPDIPEFEQLVDGVLKFADAGAAVQLVDQANTRSEDGRHFGELVQLRSAYLSQLPDARDAA